MKDRLVLDASAAVRLALGDVPAGVVRSLQACSLIVAPTLLYSETANAFWKYLTSGELSLDEALRFQADSVALVDHFTPDSELIVEAMTAAEKEAHPVYDLLYAVAARRFGCAVLTVDGRFAGLLENMGIDAVLIPGD